MDERFADIKAAVIDGRMNTVFHRQAALRKLHEAMTRESAVILDATASDNGWSPAEAAVEYFAAVRCIVAAYSTLQPTKALHEEYYIANGRNAPDLRAPIGLVYIEPQNHTFLYSVLSPLSSALAAGNCAIVHIEPNLRVTNGILRRLLPSALQDGSFEIADRRLETEILPGRTMTVIQTAIPQTPRSNQLLSIDGPCVAVVDRTADLKLAAKELATARFSFAGRSPYAPDVVLVNEFALKEFLHALVTECVSFGTHQPHATKRTTTRTLDDDHNSVAAAVEELRKRDPRVRVVVQEAGYAVADCSSTDDPSLARVHAALLCVYSIRSLDDGIDTISRNANSLSPAAYHFGAPEGCKYLCQFIASAASFVNHVPREYLIGPISPYQHCVDISNRYPVELFTVPRPQCATPTKISDKIAGALDRVIATTPSSLRLEATEPLPAMKRHSGAGVGFFDQSFFLNASMILIGALATGTCAAYTIYSRPVAV